MLLSPKLLYATAKALNQFSVEKSLGSVALHSPKLFWYIDTIFEVIYPTIILVGITMILAIMRMNMLENPRKFNIDFIRWMKLCLLHSEPTK